MIVAFWAVYKSTYLLTLLRTYLLLFGTFCPKIFNFTTVEPEFQFFIKKCMTPQKLCVEGKSKGNDDLYNASS